MSRTSRFPLNRRLCLLTMIAAVLVLPCMANGEDIDLYSGTAVTGGKPNVLLVMDNASNGNSATTILPGSNCPSWIPSGAKAHDFEQCALYNLVGSLGLPGNALNGKVNMGLMMFAPSKTGGGLFFYPNPAPTPPGPLPLLDTDGAIAFRSVIAGTPGGGTGPGTAGVDQDANKLDESMAEAWAYYTGTTGISGTKYTKALADACQKNFIIYLANVTGSNAPKNPSNVPPAEAALITANGGVTPPEIQIYPSGNKQQPNWGDEWAKFMYQSDISGISSSVAHTPQNIITYTIAVSNGCENPLPKSNFDQKCADQIGLIKSMAANGGGKYFYVSAGDVNGLISALDTILTEVQATNSVFASVSLPVSVNAQGTSLNQVYVGMFRPDATAAPRWAGNLKQYQLGLDGPGGTTGNVELQDSLGNSAISSAGTGFIAPAAVSFWTADHQTGTPRDGPFMVNASGYTGTIFPSWLTVTTNGGFWVNHPAGAGGAFDAPDGEVVDKGGVSEMTRADYLTDQSGRVIYTCSSVGGCPIGTTLPAFNVATLSGNTLFGTTGSTTPTTANLINWIRGTDNAGNEMVAGPSGLGSTPVRPSIHGDVLHSRPALVNYGGLVGIVAFYGSNDGFFRAVNGNKDGTAPGVITLTSGRNVRPGGELWSFIAPEFFSKFQHMYNNSPKLTLGAASSGKDYFFDGTTTVYQDLRVAGSPKIYIYLTARRGGRMIYALDVSDATKPPKVLWSKTNSNIPELGQTWSQPKVTLVKGNTNPVIIMGGGYDPAEDADPFTGADTMGRAIVVLDAITGATVWTACPSGCTTTVAAMTHAIPSDITLYDADGDGYTDRLYTGDLGGNIWRADIGDASTANWKVTQIASLDTTGKGTAACGSQFTGVRKFFYPPDVSPTAGGFDAVVAASGDREHPLLANPASCVVNRFYMLKDTNTWPKVPNTSGDATTTWTTITESSLVDATTALSGTTPYTPTVAKPSGFFVTLGLTGEKAVNAPLSVAGYTYFGTNAPTSTTENSLVCSANLGIARGYAINFLTGAGLNSNGFVKFDGGGLPPSPVFGLVAINPLQPTVLTPVLIGGGNQTGPGGGNNTSVLGASRVTPAGTGQRRRTYHYTEGVK